MNDDYFWTKHALDNFNKRLEINKLWIIETIKNPDLIEYVTDDTGDKIYYYKKITEFDDRVLKVVTSNNSIPIRIITFHFHKGLKGKL